jgi:hypothetical protein
MEYRKGRQHHQPAHGFVVVVVGVHVARGDEAVAFAHQPGAFGKERAGDGNGQYVKRGKRIGQTVTPDQPGWPMKVHPENDAAVAAIRKAKKGIDRPAMAYPEEVFSVKYPLSPQ